MDDKLIGKLKLTGKKRIYLVTNSGKSDIIFKVTNSGNSDIILSNKFRKVQNTCVPC